MLYIFQCKFVEFAIFVIFFFEILPQKSDKAIYIKAAAQMDIIRDTLSEQHVRAASNTPLEAKTAIADKRYGNIPAVAIGGMYPKICDTQSIDIKNDTE